MESTGSPTSAPAPSPPPADEARLAALDEALLTRGPYEAVELLESESDDTIALVLRRQNPAVADQILWELAPERRERVLAAAPPEQREQWSRNHSFPEDTLGRLMEPPFAVLRPEQTVSQAVERLRPLVQKTLVTYGWVTNETGALVGVIAFRELLFAKSDDQPLAELMVKAPFSLRPETSIADGMREALKRHYPVYPICGDGGRLLGTVRGQTLFEHQAFELSAQPGAMVGVEKEERLGTPWARSLKFRHPWLQLNLFTAFIAAAVVGMFQTTLDRLVVLAVFLPVLAGQSGNTGCQALAVSLRGITLGELGTGRAKALVMKEALLGVLNGALVGLTAGVGMYALASMQGNPAAFSLACVVFFAMIGSCAVSGIAGAIVPVTLRRLGADPATASSIFLTTATDVVSMGLFLGLATLLVL
jgi:magnesium transporter